MIISHRGRGNGLPENSLVAFEAALKRGAGAIECDLRLTADDQVIVHHGGTFGASKLGVRRQPLRELAHVADAEQTEVLRLDRLFEFISEVSAPFYLEVKDQSPRMASAVVEHIRRGDLWSRVHLVGFPVLINAALRAREEHPRLQVWRILLAPALAATRLSLDGSGVLLGWQDSVPFSERLFRATLSAQRLAGLQRRLQHRGLGVVAGVITRAEGFDHFRQAGIQDFVTDDVRASVEHLASRSAV